MFTVSNNWLEVTDCYKYLGCSFLENITEINYVYKLQEMRNSLKMCSKRKLTALWKIAVHKTLIISMITHIFK